MRIPIIAFLIGILIMPLIQYDLHASERIMLSDKWRIQPANNSSVPPDEAQWGVMFSANGFPGSWNGAPVENKGTSWNKTPRKDVNSLWYQQSFAAPANWQDKRVFLDFTRIEGDAIIFLNGARVMELQRPGGEVDCTSHVKFGADNLLRVFITRNYTDISRDYRQDPLRYLSRDSEWGKIPMSGWGLGITAPVTLIARPRPAAITDVFAITSWRKKEITFRIETEADAPQREVSLTSDIYDANGKKVMTVAGEPVDVPSGRSTHEIKASWPNPILWELDRGYLYSAQPTLSLNGQVVDRHEPIKFGFREIWSEGDKLMMNGHLSRWRLTMNYLSDNPNALSFFRLMGYNSTYFQANPTMWWRCWKETPVFPEQLLEEMDRVGFAALLPVPGLTLLRGNLLTNHKLREDYDREMKLFIRRYRNHPCVMAWIEGMISYCPRDAITPQGMGRRYTGKAAEVTQVKVIEAAREIVRRHDATRLVYSHADGNAGDIASSNMYLNFAPLQEREEWPMAWAKSGDMPYQMSEFGQPYTANFWKGKRFLMTEYLAMYFGNEAYVKETDANLQRTLEKGITNKSGHGSNLELFDDYPLYWDFQRLFVRNTNRAYRSWNVNCGWAYWNINTQYGHPPGVDTSNPNSWTWNQYGLINKPITQKPSWANPNFDIHSQANKSLLVYLAGYPRHTDKTHSFFAGEAIAKQIAVVWDGPGDTDIDCEWTLRDSADNTLLTQNVRLQVKCGEISMTPIHFTAPEVIHRSEYTLVLKVRQNNGETTEDRFAMQVFPKPQPLAMKTQIAVFDPLGKTTAWLRELEIPFHAWNPGQSLAGVDLLVIGREALKPGDVMPYKPADIDSGLRVMIFEQRSAVWQGLGFRTIEVMPRYVFAVDQNNPVLSGLHPEDLINWRGSPDLLPEGKNISSETQHAPKWTNTHAIASVVLQIPRVVGFRPILAAEFDMDYSPLIRWNYGKGIVWFCSLDLTGRVGYDPAATIAARNLLRHTTMDPFPATRAVCYEGGTKGLTLLHRLGVSPKIGFTSENPRGTLLVLGEGKNKNTLEALQRFVADGGRILSLPKTKEELASYGLKCRKRSLYRCALPPSTAWFEGIGPRLLRWRDMLTVETLEAETKPETTVVSDGVIALRKEGKGSWLFCQLEPALLAERYPNDQAKQQSNQLSVWRLEQLVARLLTNGGAAPDPLQAKRLCFLDLGPRYKILSHWNVLGPFLVDKDDGEQMLNTKFPGEETAVTGDSNPNNNFSRKDGRVLNWRTTVKADEKGYINLGTALGANSLAVAYVTCLVNSDNPREAVLRLGADWRLQVWVNGELVFRTLKGLNRPAAYTVKIHLRKGENTISCKVGSGSRGFGFYADMSMTTVNEGVVMDEGLRKQSFYAGNSQSNEFDPYEFFYW